MECIPKFIKMHHQIHAPDVSKHVKTSWEPSEGDTGNGGQDFRAATSPAWNEASLALSSDPSIGLSATWSLYSTWSDKDLVNQVTQPASWSLHLVSRFVVSTCFNACKQHEARPCEAQVSLSSSISGDRRVVHLKRWRVSGQIPLITFNHYGLWTMDLNILTLPAHGPN